MRSSSISTFTGFPVWTRYRCFRLRLQGRAASVPPHRCIAGVAYPDQRLRFARGWFAGIITWVRIGHHGAQLRKMAARAARLARGGNTRVEEKIAAEIYQGLILDRTRGGTSIIGFDCAQTLRRCRFGPY